MMSRIAQTLCCCLLSPYLAAMPEELSPTTSAASGAIIVIHADPGIEEEGVGERCPGPAGRSRTNEVSAERWSLLNAIVGAADFYGHKLTIELGIDWVNDFNNDCIKATDVDRSTVIGWVADGHQIGFHHHACGHAAYDEHDNAGATGAASIPAYSGLTYGAYTTTCVAARGSSRINPMSTAYGALGRMAAAIRTALGTGVPYGLLGNITVGGLGGSGGVQEIRGFEWDEMLRFATGTPNTTVGTVGCVDYGEVDTASGAYTTWPDILTFPHLRLAIGNLGGGGVDEAELTSDALSAGTGEYVGIVFHVAEYIPVDVDGDGILDSTEVQGAMAALSSVGLQARTVAGTVVEDGLSPCS